MILMKSSLFQCFTNCWCMQGTGEYFFPTVSVDDNNLLGEGVPKPQYKKYRVFVQSTGSGARYLPAGSLLLYEQVNNKIMVSLGKYHAWALKPGVYEPMKECLTDVLGKAY